MTEYLLVFHDRDDAEGVAEELADEDLTRVRVVAESLAGEDDAEDVDWVVHIVQDTITDQASAAARALATRFEALAEANDGWLDEDRSTVD